VGAPADLSEQLGAARQQVAVLTRERDEALAGWDMAARFVHQTEERARGEVDGLAAALQQAQQALARQEREADRRAVELLKALDAERQRAETLGRELDAGRSGARQADPAELESLRQAAARHGEELATLRQQLAAARSEAPARVAEGEIQAAAGHTDWDQERVALRAEAAQALDQARQQREAAGLAEAARVALAADLQKARAELAEARERAASLPAAPSYAEISAHYSELLTRVDSLRLDVEQLQEEGTGRRAGKTGVLGRLLGRSPAPSTAPEVDPAGVGRRLDTLRVEVAVDRERALRTLVELEKVALQKQLADVLGRLRQAEERDPQRQQAGEAMPLPFGGKSVMRPEDRVFLDPPAPASQGNRPSRPR
jgi:hypothetical protein